MKMLCTFILSCVALGFGQEQEKISTMDFVRILNNNTEEAIFYYQNNWEELRKLALNRNYIDSYNIYHTEDDTSSFHLILLTTYKNIEQYDFREKNFDELIEMRNGLQLLNDKKPNEFRETLFRKSLVKQFN